MLLLLLIAFMVVYLPAYYTTYSGYGRTPPPPTDRQNEARAEMAAKVWKQNISFGEYMENVFPEFLDNVSDECREQYYSQPMIWPDRNTTSIPFRLVWGQC